MTVSNGTIERDEYLMKLQRLKDELPRGYYEKISAITGLGSTTIYKVLNGFTENVSVLNAAIQLRDDYIAQKETIINNI
jgi:hypothetical protein